MNEIAKSPPREASATFDGGLEGSLSGTVSLGPLPVDRPPPTSKDLIERLLELFDKSIEWQELFINAPKWWESFLKVLGSLPFMFKAIILKRGRSRLVRG